MPSKIRPTHEDFFARIVTFRAVFVGLLALLLWGTAVPAFAQNPQTPDPSIVASQVKKFGVGKSVKVWLVSGELIRGHIRSIGPTSFTVKINKSRAETSIPYAQVTAIKDPGPLTWLLVGAAIVLITVLIIHH